MLDISMCGRTAETCSQATRCYRHEASGTVPNGRFQSMAMFGPLGAGCDSFWPVRGAGPIKGPDAIAVASGPNSPDRARLEPRSRPDPHQRTTTTGA